MTEDAKPFAVASYNNIRRPFVGIKLLTAKMSCIDDASRQHGGVAVNFNARLADHVEGTVSQRA